MPYGGKDKAACRGLVPPSTLKKFKCWKDSLASRYTICKWGQILSKFWHFSLTITERGREDELLCRSVSLVRKSSLLPGFKTNILSTVYHTLEQEKYQFTRSIIWTIKAHSRFSKLFYRWEGTALGQIDLRRLC